MRVTFCSFVEREAKSFAPETGNDPRQDDFDIWLGTDIIAKWIAARRHAGVSNWLYLDGHVTAREWNDVVTDLYPDGAVLVGDGSYLE